MNGHVVTIPGGPLVCGFCGEAEHFPGLAGQWLVLGYLELTGIIMLGVGLATGELVVLAEARRLDGRTENLPHLCEAIPESVRAEYSADIEAARTSG